jgi:hypothetical protein
VLEQGHLAGIIDGTQSLGLELIVVGPAEPTPGRR